MNFHEQAELTLEKLCKSLEISPPGDMKATAAEIIEKSLINAAVDARKHCAELAINHSDGEKDTARKISDDIQKANDLLIVNLSSLR